MLEFLDGRLFTSNPRVRWLELAGNRITAISRTLFDYLQNINVLNLFNNVCISDAWIVSESTTVDMIRQALQPCFDNFVEVKRFTMKLRGNTTLLDTDGNVIGKL